MTGFRADADPTIFPDAKISGTYILDPWYPRHLEHLGSVGPARDVPGQRPRWSATSCRWKRPEGTYPDRDGLFISVVPTIAVRPAADAG